MRAGPSSTAIGPAAAAAAGPDDSKMAASAAAAMPLPLQDVASLHV
jgi:hypothetical protein